MRTLSAIAILALPWLATTTTAGEIPSVTAERAGMSSERLERITEMNRRYTDAGKIAGVLTAVVRNGQLVYQGASGVKGAEDPRPIAMDDLFRIYSMTKPITAVAAMQLYEQGRFQLTDPVSKFVPEFADLKVYDNGNKAPLTREMTMQHLLSHTAGFSYGFDPQDPVDRMYNEARLWHARDLDEFAARLATLPLKYQPGTRWHYSVAVDVTGLVVQRLSGQRFDQYLHDNLFVPLDMVDTFFEVPAKKIGRFLPNHVIDPVTNKARLLDLEGVPEAGAAVFDICRAMCDFSKVTLFAGGGGLVSTLRDYVRFAEAIRNGGELGGERILSPKTVAYMSRNHLDASMEGGATGEQPTLVGTRLNGFGFGLGFGVVTDTTAAGVIGSNGQYYWGGAAGTVFWIDPVEDIVVVSMMQLLGGWPTYRPDLRVATYQALVQSNE